MNSLLNIFLEVWDLLAKGCFVDDKGSLRIPGADYKFDGIDTKFTKSTLLARGNIETGIETHSAMKASAGSNVCVVNMVVGVLSIVIVNGWM